MKAQSPGSGNEGKDGQRLRPIGPVARGGAARDWKDTRRLVQAQGLPAHPTLRRDLTNQQPVSSHAGSLNLPPLGQGQARNKEPGGYSSTCRRRSALAITETELRLMAALAIIGLSKRPKTGYSKPAATGTPSTL